MPLQTDRHTYIQRRRFAVAGPSTWNSLPDSLCDPELSLNTFKRQLKTYFFYEILTTERTKCTRDFFEYLRYKFTLYSLTYLQLLLQLLLLQPLLQLLRLQHAPGRASFWCGRQQTTTTTTATTTTTSGTTTTTITRTWKSIILARKIANYYYNYYYYNNYCYNYYN